MNFYEPTQIRKHTKIEQAAFIERALEEAAYAPATIEGSLDKARSTTFYFTNLHNALLRFEELVKEGWSYDVNYPALPAYAGASFSLTLRAPDDVWETYPPLIAARAESLYIHQVEDHNKNARRLLAREAAIEAEIQAQEAQRLVALREEIAGRYDSGQLRGSR